MIWIDMVRIRHNCIWISEKYKLLNIFKSPLLKDFFLWQNLLPLTLPFHHHQQHLSSAIKSNHFLILKTPGTNLSCHLSLYCLTSGHSSLHLQTISGTSLPLSHDSLAHKPAILEGGAREALTGDAEWGTWHCGRSASTTLATRGKCFSRYGAELLPAPASSGEPV